MSAKCMSPRILLRLHFVCTGLQTPDNTRRLAAPPPTPAVARPRSKPTALPWFRSYCSAGAACPMSSLPFHPPILLTWRRPVPRCLARAARLPPPAPAAAAVCPAAAAWAAEDLLARERMCSCQLRWRTCWTSWRMRWAAASEGAGLSGPLGWWQWEDEQGGSAGRR